MAAQFDLVIRNGSVIDGTGAPARSADVAVRGDRIVAVGVVREKGGVEIDARGLAVAPGFIDVHTHDDWAVFTAPEMDFKTMQGVTTDVVGNCGMGAAPNPAATAMFAFLHPNAKVPEWTDYRGYLDAIDREPSSLNVAVLAGHGTMRLAAMGTANREPDARELSSMCKWTSDAVEAGVVGLSTGLIYEPGRYAKTEEIIELARQMRGSGAIYTSHMRDEGEYLLEAVSETIRIGEEAGVAVQISHHKASEQRNWGKVKQSLELIEKARARGLDVTADQYPYTSGSTGLSAVLQNGAFDPNSKGSFRHMPPESVRLASVAKHPEYETRTIKELSDDAHLAPVEMARKILADDFGATVILESMDEGDVRIVMRHPTTMIGSDGIPSAGKPHPRLYGTFPRVLGRYSRDLKLMPLEEAVNRMTGMSAAKFRLKDRGVIREGAFADLVVFDPAKIIDTGSYAEPRRYPDGIRDVFVNGTAVVKDGAHTHSRPGRGIRRG